MKLTWGKFCAVMMVVAVAGLAYAATIGPLEQKITTMTEVGPGILTNRLATSSTGTWTATGGGVWRVVDVMSTATGGTLRVELNTGVTDAGGVAITRLLGSTTITQTLNRTVDVGASAYVWSGQSLIFRTASYDSSVTNTITNMVHSSNHKIFTTLERVQE